MLQKQNLLTILMLALASTLFIFTACEEDEDDDLATDDPANSVPVANFEADQTNIAAGESVTFADQSTNNPISWSWDFGDGSTSAEASPSHTYNSAGSYTVGLTVTNDYGSDTKTKTDYIIVSSSVNWGDGVTDIDGNNYPSVIIGNQEWMAENLKTTIYNNGTSIDLVTDNTAWDNNTTGAYCWYDNDQSQYAETYGALYNWYAVNTGNLCPDGWHVPTHEEWTALEDYIASDGHNGVEGTALKATSGWNNDGNGTDDYGFTALPGGGRNYGGTFLNIGGYGYWWNATGGSTGNAWLRGLDCDYSGVYRGYGIRGSGFSVRCLRD